jgi:hypothetical protein
VSLNPIRNARRTPSGAVLGAPETRPEMIACGDAHPAVRCISLPVPHSIDSRKKLHSPLASKSCRMQPPGPSSIWKTPFLPLRLPWPAHDSSRGRTKCVRGQRRRQLQARGFANLSRSQPCMRIIRSELLRQGTAFGSWCCRSDESDSWQVTGTCTPRVAPLQGSTRYVVSRSQGVALGWHVTAPSGRRQSCNLRPAGPTRLGKAAGWPKGVSFRRGSSSPRRGSTNQPGATPRVIGAKGSQP